MKSETPPAAVSTGPAVPTELAPPPPLVPLLPPSRIRFSSSHRGARLARLLCGQQLDEWGIPRSTSASAVITAVVAELAANAATHGRTPGRDFEVRMSLAAELVRVEVIDTRPDRLPRAPGIAPRPPVFSTSGRGLLLVAAYADRWGWGVRDPYTKVVWAEVLHQA
ncbi:ATP-binding protein [Streptomyces paludis]|uniref:ATP-binding protein n=1 Tax=Streptomyces paludis TaxID=2282738 RepID=A0A345HU05_9ACTN|nr:ATP-binding protein [Streptomyces paludis]AXG80179.1 ATP-binding protein [Streptomyces paludis]